MPLLSRFSFICIIPLIFTSCVTYHQRTIAFQNYFSESRFEEANETLDKNKKAPEGKDKLLFFLQKGTVLHELGRYEESNEYFEKAYIFTEDYRETTISKLATYTINGASEYYIGEDHELVLLHYYKALNYLLLKKYESALVECRRLNNRLNFLNDSYSEKSNVYKSDAFALNLMGIIYEATGEYNDAFISYRNAVKSYETIYATHLATPIPLQLKRDLLRMAKANGFNNELDFYKKKFGINITDEKSTNEELIFFWNNGLAPVKTNLFIDFVVFRDNNNKFYLINEALSLRFPVPAGKATGLSSLRIVRVAFPKYLERRPYYNHSEIIVDNGQKYNLELGENINTIAFQTLNDRMFKEFSNSIIRLAVKQAAAAEISSKSQNLGAVVSVFNAVTEKADTRNWQTLPYSISYARVPLKIGINKLTLNTTSENQESIVKEYEVNCKKNDFLILKNHTLKSLPLTPY